MKRVRLHMPLLATALFAAVALSLASCASHMELPLNWTPTTPESEVQKKIGQVDLAGVKVQFTKLEDTRANPSQIGLKPDAKQPKTVSTKSDVGLWVAQNLGQSISNLTTGSGLEVTDKDPTIVISGKVVEFFVTEKWNYEGTVKLALEVKKPDGTKLYDVNAAGASSRFAPMGFKAENYMEALSDSLLVAAQYLVQDAGFRKALKGEKP